MESAPSEFTVDVISQLPSSLESDYLFIVLGSFPETFVLSPDEALIIQTYLDMGGSVYMEGADTWAWNAQTDAHAMFNIWGIDDGEDDLNAFSGVGCFRDVQLSSQSQQYTDRLAPLEGAFVLSVNENPAYVNAIGFDSGIYRTVGASFSFASLNDGEYTKIDLMNRILDFFDNGCTALKPPPMALVAYSNYDSSVPLLWEPPVLQPPLPYSHYFQQFLSIGITEPLKKRRSMSAFTLNDSPSAYKIYRAEDSLGPFHLIADDITQQYYLDETAQFDTDYWYYVTAVYNGVEGEQSNCVKACAKNRGSKLTSAYTFTAPIINGVIDKAEWMYTLSSSLNADSSAYIYAMNDSSKLYIAVTDENNTFGNDGDQLGIYFDMNKDAGWPTNFGVDGNLWVNLYQNSTQNFFRQIKGDWPHNLVWTVPQQELSTESAITFQNNVMHCEVAIDLAQSVFQASSTDSVGFYLYNYDAGTAQQTAAYPSALLDLQGPLHWAAPVLYGTLYLGQEGVFFRDSIDVSFPGAFTLNDNDGHAVNLLILQISGSGSIGIEQHNLPYPGVPNADYLNLYWQLNVDPEIRTLGAKLSFHYTEADADGFAETNDYWGIAAYDPVNEYWRWLGEDLNAIERTITVDYEPGFSIYMMFRRQFGDYNADGQVDSLDATAFQSVWHTQQNNAFTPHSLANFFNYHQQNQNGIQQINIQDFQILGDRLQTE